MKKFKLLFTLLLVISLTLTACGTEEATPDTSDKTETGSEASETESSLKGDLVYWSMWNSTEPQAIALSEGINMFMEMHPNVNIEVQWNGRDIRQTLQPALDNGEKIDIWDEDLERVHVSWGDYSISLEDYLDKEYANTNGKPYSEAVMPALLDLGRSFSSTGELQGIPYQPFVFAYMYNKDHFEQAGIDAVPTTWEEFLVVCEKLKAAGFTPLTSDDAYMEISFGQHVARLKGVDFVAELMNDTTGELWNDPAVVAAAKDYEELASKGYFSETIASNLFPAGQQDVAAGTVSMYLNGTWLVNEIMGTTGPDFKWGTFSYPAVRDGVDGPSAATFGSQAFSINKDCATPDVAMELLAHLTTGHYDNFIAKSSYGVPVSGDAEWPPQLLDAKAVFENLDTNYPWAANVLANPDKSTLIREQFTGLVSGSITADEFIENMK